MREFPFQVISHSFLPSFSCLNHLSHLSPSFHVFSYSIHSHAFINSSLPLISPCKTFIRLYYFSTVLFIHFLLPLLHPPSLTFFCSPNSFCFLFYIHSWCLRHSFVTNIFFHLLFHSTICFFHFSNSFIHILCL